MLPLGEWWQVGMLVLGLLALVAFVVWMIRRDSRRLPPILTCLLTGLRLFVIGCLVAYLLNPGQRSETRLLTNSRLAVLVDTSLSMGLRDRGGVEADESRRRIDDVIDWVDDSEELTTLNRSHDVTVYRFGDTNQPEPIVALPKTEQSEVESAAPVDRSERQWQRAALLAIAAIVASAVALVLLLGWLVVYLRSPASPTVGRLARSRLASHPEMAQPEPNSKPAFWLTGAIGAMMIAALLFGFADLADPQNSLLTAVGLASNEAVELQARSAVGSDQDGTESPMTVSDTAWEDELLPSGTSTSLGSALQFIVNKERGGPLAGVVVFTDGQSNVGAPVSVAATGAANANVPIFPVGIGNTELLRNVEVADVQAPPRVFPGDRFKIKSIIKSSGLAGRSINVKILSVDENEQEAEQLEGEGTILLGEDGEAILFEIEIAAESEGKRRYVVRTEVPAVDVDQTDNERSVNVEIVQRKTKVLLIAGGPNREFRFLRNQLYRDSDITLHVWLQSAKSGADQESDELLQEFPTDENELFSYDCIVAFDADWRLLALEQAAALERWVAEKAGGLILIAGPVNTPEWTRRPRGDESIDLVRQLYPVSFFSQGTAQLKLGRFGGKEAYPLDFSREGRASRFLWLGESAVDSAQSWDQFDGVFGYYAVNESKPGADVLASFADPDTAIEGELPIYLASQFYGAGRVFFQASAEMWRVRSIDVDYFQDYYTQIIRWASQGRLLRDSNRGVLLTDRDQCWMGDQVNVQAILRNAADEPLMAESVSATLTRPDGSKQVMLLQASGGAVRPGTFDAQFPTTSEGEYRISLPVPESPSLDVLTTTVRSSIPDLEKAKPQRNDLVLQEIANKSQGHYYVGVESFASSQTNPFSPNQLIAPQDQETFLTGTLDRFFQRKLMMWLLGWITLGLATEWTLRRLHKLS